MEKSRRHGNETCKALLKTLTTKNNVATLEALKEQNSWIPNKVFLDLEGSPHLISLGALDLLYPRCWNFNTNIWYVDFKVHAHELSHSRRVRSIRPILVSSLDLGRDEVTKTIKRFYEPFLEASSFIDLMVMLNLTKMEDAAIDILDEKELAIVANLIELTKNLGLRGREAKKFLFNIPDIFLNAIISSEKSIVRDSGVVIPPEDLLFEIVELCSKKALNFKSAYKATFFIAKKLNELGQTLSKTFYVLFRIVFYGAIIDEFSGDEWGVIALRALINDVLEGLGIDYYAIDPFTGSIIDHVDPFSYFATTKKMAHEIVKKSFPCRDIIEEVAEKIYIESIKFSHNYSTPLSNFMKTDVSKVGRIFIETISRVVENISKCYIKREKGQGKNSYSSGNCYLEYGWLDNEETPSGQTMGDFLKRYNCNTFEKKALGTLRKMPINKDEEEILKDSRKYAKIVKEVLKDVGFEETSAESV